MPATKKALKKVASVSDPVIAPKGDKIKNYLHNPTFIVLSVLVIAGLIAAGYFFYQYQKTQSLLQNPSLAKQQEAQDLVSQVGKLLELPVGEFPTVATVSDITKLRDQKFFQKAKNGDKVLIYTNAKEAILYDPSLNKIVQVGPIDVGGQIGQGTTAQKTASVVVSQASASPSPTPHAVKVALYNGTGIAGLSAKTQSALESKLSTVKVISRGNATGISYKTTEVIDLTGSNNTAAMQIAKALGGQVSSTLPSGEKKPDSADILVILGQ